MSFFARAPRVFLPKRVIFGSFLTVKLLFAVQVALHQELLRVDGQGNGKKSAEESSAKE
jgi:hypothetical protein